MVGSADERLGAEVVIGDEVVGCKVLVAIVEGVESIVVLSWELPNDDVEEDVKDTGVELVNDDESIACVGKELVEDFVS